MALSTVSADAAALATDLNQIIQHVQGQAGSTDAYHFRSSSGNDYIITLADNAGARSVLIKDSDGSTVASIDSDGALTATTVTLTNLDIPTSAAPAQTAEGRAVWNSATDVLTIGDASSRKTFYPGYPEGTTVLATGATDGFVLTADGAGAAAWGDDHRLTRYSEAVPVDTDSGATHTIDLDDGTVFALTLTANCTLTFSNPVATGRASSFTLELIQDGTGSRTVTWPASVTWAGGTEPTLSTDAAAVDVLTFYTRDGGTTYRGFTGGLAFA